MSRRNHTHQMDAFLGNSYSNLTGDATSNNIVSPVVNPTPYPTAPKPIVGLNGKPLAVENLAPTPIKTPRNPSTATPVVTAPILIPDVRPTVTSVPRTPRPTTVVNVTPSTTPTILTPIAVVPVSSLNPAVTSDNAPISMPAPLGGSGGGGGGGGSSDESSQKVASGSAGSQPSFIRRNWLPLILVASAIYVFVKKPLNKK